MSAPLADSDEKGKNHQESALLGPQHQTAEKCWGRWRDCKKKRKRDKTLWELLRSFSQEGTGTKLTSLMYQWSLMTFSKARKPWAWKEAGETEAFCTFLLP